MNITRRFQRRIFQAFENPFITLLSGPRRVGKSTLVERYFFEFPQDHLVLLNLDELEIRDAIDEGALNRLIQNKLGFSLDGLAQKIWLVVDEAQKSPALFDQVKILYDRFKDSGLFKCILTGSGSLSLAEHSSESLGGRIFSYDIFPFVLEEAFALRYGESPPSRPFSQLMAEKNPAALESAMLALQPQRERLQECLREQLIWGGFPELLQLSSMEERKRYLANYRQTYLEKDIRSLEQVGDLKAFNRLLELSAFQIGNLRQDKRLCDAVGVSSQTLAKYLSILEATCLYAEIPPYIHTPFKRLFKSSKSYLADNGLVSYLRGIYDLETLLGASSIGAWFENWAVGCIQALLGGEAVPPRLYFWKTSGNVEVDLIVDLGAWVLPLEIKYSAVPDPKQVKHLKRFLHEEKRAPFGMILYNGPCEYQPRERILYFPAWAAL